MEPSDYGNKVIAPKSCDPRDVRLEGRAVGSSALTSPLEEAAEAGRGGVLLLDLSGDMRAAAEWAESQFPEARIIPVNKADLKWSSKLAAVKRLRVCSAHTFAIFASDLEAQSAVALLLLFGMLVAPRAVFGDRRGRAIARSRPAFFFIDAPKLALDLILGYLVIAPAAWLLIELLSVALVLRPVVRTGRPQKPQRTHQGGRKILVLRATLGAAIGGGMATHLDGFVRACGKLGHTLRLFLSGAPECGGIAALFPASDEVNEVCFIKPSATFGPTKTIFELWNNLAFAGRTLGRVTSQTKGGIDFIYQRYSRFNCTGVLLSIVEGLPLALEYNGSEVWVSQRWDPIGQRRLLRRFESLNQRAADLIFTVSEVERGNLIKAGVDARKIVVNPNGVDPEEFRPFEGSEVRTALNIGGEEVVVGFVGTFGPWHGAPSLAAAALRVSEAARCHFLFVGDGDERPRAEAIIRSGGGRVRAHFLGRAPHALVPGYLAACDILASPHAPAADGSEFFGSPTKLFEYMAVGRAIVASRLGQIADIIADEENGLLVPAGDPDALAQAIERLAQDAPLRARLGAAARRTVQDKYTWLHNAARVIDGMERGGFLDDGTRNRQPRAATRK